MKVTSLNMRLPEVELNNSCLPPIRHESRESHQVSHLTGYFQRPFHKPPAGGTFYRLPRTPQRPKPPTSDSPQKRHWSGPEQLTNPLVFDTVHINNRPSTATPAGRAHTSTTSRRYTSNSGNKDLSKRLQRIVEKYNNVKDQVPPAAPSVCEPPDAVSGPAREPGSRGNFDEGNNNDLKPHLPRGNISIRASPWKHSTPTWDGTPSEYGKVSEFNSELASTIPDHCDPVGDESPADNDSDDDTMVENPPESPRVGKPLPASSPPELYEGTFAQRVAARRVPKRSTAGRTASSSSNIMTDPLGAGHATAVKGKLRRLKSLYPQPSQNVPALNKNIWALKTDSDDTTTKRSLTKKGPIKKMTIGSFGLSHNTPKEKIQDSDLALLYEKGIFHEHLVNIKASIDRAKTSLSKDNNQTSTSGGGLNATPSANGGHGTADDILFYHGREDRQWSNPATSKVCHITPLTLAEQSPGAQQGPMQSRVVPSGVSNTRCWAAGGAGSDSPFAAHLPKVVGHGTGPATDTNDMESPTEGGEGGRGGEPHTTGVSLGLSELIHADEYISGHKPFRGGHPAIKGALYKNHHQLKKTKFAYNMQDALSRENTSGGCGSTTIVTDHGVTYITPRLDRLDMDEGSRNAASKFVSNIKSKSNRISMHPKKSSAAKSSMSFLSIPNMNYSNKNEPKSLNSSDEDDGNVEFLVPPCSPQSSIYEPERYSPKPTYQTFDGAFLPSRNGKRMQTTWKAV